MINLNGNFENLLKLPLKIIVALCISSGLILFLPNKVIDLLYMKSFRSEFGFVLGIIFLVSLSIILCTIVVQMINYIFNKVRDKKIIKARNKIMEDLDSNERKLLKMMFDEDDKTLSIPYNSGMVVKLSSYGLISPVSSTNYIDLLDSSIPYFLQPWVCEYIKEHAGFLDN